MNISADVADSPGEGPTGLSPHEAETVESLVTLHLEHDRAASPLQAVIDATTAMLARPAAVLVILIVIAALCISVAGGSRNATEGTLFAWMEFGGTISALVVALLILVTQRRADELADRRAKLTLELALLADRKTSKLIALLGDLRRDHPDLQDAGDPEASAMARASDPRDILGRIEGRNET